MSTLSPPLSLSVGHIAMPGTRTTQNVGPVLGACYPVDAILVSDEANLTDRNARVIVYTKALGLGKFDAVVSDAEGNEHHVIVGATAAVGDQWTKKTRQFVNKILSQSQNCMFNLAVSVTAFPHPAPTLDQA